MISPIFGTVDDYINRLLAPEDDALAATLASLTAAGMPQISVTPGQGKFLQVLAAACGAKRILELGTLAGYSTIWLARALPPGGRLVTVEANPDHAAVARQNIERAGVGDRIEIRVGKGLEVLPQMVAAGEQPFDLIFIDADKPPYVEYFEYALQLSRPGTIIVADNVIRGGKVLDAESTDESVKGAQRFNEMISANDRVTAIILQTVGAKGHDGMAIAVVR